MMAIYEKPVRLLLKDMVEESNITQEDVIRREEVFAWFKEKYPKIKDGTISAHLLKMSTNAPSRIHYNVNPNGEDDLLYQIDSQRFRLYNPSTDPTPIYQKIPDEGKSNGQEPDGEHAEVSEFAYEKDLQNFLSKNLFIIEPGLRLYEEEGITGVEFPVGTRYIDILALDKDTNYVVIELKVSRGYDRVVGQLLRYIAWIKKNHAEVGQHVRGIIIARQISDDLLLACSELKNVELYEYELSISLKKVKPPEGLEFNI
jgi:hypothetical protein